jgi:hypothetical protein
MAAALEQRHADRFFEPPKLDLIAIRFGLRVVAGHDVIKLPRGVPQEAQRPLPLDPLAD